MLANIMLHNPASNTRIVSHLVKKNPAPFGILNFIIACSN